MTSKQAAKAMLTPRHTRAGKGFVRGWYYIDAQQIEVLAPPRSDRGDASCVRLSRKQLEQALAIMRAAQNGNPNPQA